MGEMLDRWSTIEAALAELDDAAKRLAAVSHKALDSARGGSLGALNTQVASATEATRALESLLRAATEKIEELAAITTPDSLATEVEALLRERLPRATVWRARNEVVAYPVVTRVDVSGDKIRATVGSGVVKAQRPDLVADAVVAAHCTEFRADRFVTALYGAFRLLHPDKSVGSVELERIFKVLATSAPGQDGYGAAAFTNHLQLLKASGLDEAAPGVRFVLRNVAASSSAYRLVLADKESVNVGSIDFEHAKPVA